MGLRESKRIKFIKEKGVIAFLWNAIDNTSIATSIANLVLQRPRLVLSSSQCKTFKLAYKHFEENYRNIIVISPLFFMKNLKKHIEWLESDTFRSQYGSIENLENLRKNTIGATMMSPQKDSRTDEFTPPPPPLRSS
ncbi:hypothetical protein XJ32_06975 [Helicobacter bilis]|uniref:Uncharacterized protein n=1 Tax=Helicobacter bilis TaxID=37372 RepID=A0A1Q2LHL7_9HELI|nr:hypothetical protein [Helicobacter bilis]AQQ59869.1 hypothetical protein XJ32_06975 [Helicobacter bilis]